MKLYSIDNSQPNFGMAFVKPETPKQMKQLASYLKINEPFVNRGFKKFVKSQAKNPHNIEYAGDSFLVYIDDYSFKTVPINDMETRSTKSPSFGKAVKNIFKNLYCAVFKPEAFLPKELRQAGKMADEHLANDIKNAAEKVAESNRIKTLENLLK